LLASAMTPTTPTAPMATQIEVIRDPYAGEIIMDLPGGKVSGTLSWEEAERLGGELIEVATKGIQLQSGASGWTQIYQPPANGDGVAAWWKGGTANGTFRLDALKEGRVVAQYQTDAATAWKIGRRLYPEDSARTGQARYRKLRAAVKDTFGAELSPDGKIVFPQNEILDTPQMRIRRWLLTANAILLMLSLLIDADRFGIGPFIAGLRLVFIASGLGLAVWQASTLLPIIFG